MTTTANETNRKVVLAARPRGLPSPTDFRLEEEPLASLADGQVRVEVSHLSIDAFIRTTLETEAYHGSVPLGGTIIALGVGRVRESRSGDFAPSDWVFGPLLAQSCATLPAALLRRIEVERAPATAYLGALGLTTGQTAWVGVREVAKVKPGAAPDGVDVYFDNVGGPLLDVVLDQIELRARVVICGAISQYGGEVAKGVRGPSLYLRLAERQSRMEGFAVTHFPEALPRAEAELADWLREGKVRLPEHVMKGLENFGGALVTLFTGGHTGKLLLAV